jgi:hypothetical protein
MRHKLMFAMLFASLADCADSAPTASAAELAQYAEVERIVKTSCALETCHGFMVANAHMELMHNDLRAAWIDVPACEYSPMMRVKPGAPEESWVMVKLAGPVHFEQYADFIDFKPAADWLPGPPECSGGNFDDGMVWFGTRMPPAGTATVAAEDVDTIRGWIEAGAPVPDDTARDVQTLD